MEADAPLSVPSLSLWFCLVHVYFSWDSAKILPEAGWVLTTCVQYVPTCLLSICSFGCIQYMCNMNTHTPLKLPLGAALSMSLWRRWEMDMVVQNFSAGRCCNSVSSTETLRQDGPRRTFQWCCGTSGEHISKYEMYTSEDLSAEYQMLLLLELLWTEKETHYIVLNKAEGSNFAWNVNRKYVKNKSTGFCLSNVN